MDVRIGVTDARRELEIELPDDTDREELKAQVAAALAADAEVLWLTDRKGRDVGVPAAKLAFVEIGSADGRSIGFGA
jgi:hypothetical protein